MVSWYGMVWYPLIYGIYDIFSVFRFNASMAIHPFAFRVHTHTLGRAVVAYLVRGNSFRDGPILLGRGNPQWPQAFYPVATDVLIRPGDFLLLRCVYDAVGRRSETLIGET